MVKFYMTIGLPASGKSTWAGKQNMDWHSSDAIREELKTNDNEVVFSEMRSRTVRSLEAGRDCIYDATNLTRKRRKDILQIAKKRHAKRVCALFLAPISLCKERNKNRDRTVPEFVYDKMIRQFDVPLLRAEFDEIVIFSDGEMSQEEKNMLSDGYRNSFDQKSKYHSLTLGEHMAKTDLLFGEMFGGEYHSFVWEAAKCHDMGKPFTFSEDEDKNGHFYGHENAGAYWYLVQHVDDADFWRHHYKVAVLINWHMRPYVWEQSDKAKLRDLWYIDRYDANMYGQIMAISKADRKAH